MLSGTPSVAYTHGGQGRAGQGSGKAGQRRAEARGRGHGRQGRAEQGAGHEEAPNPKP